MKLALIDMLPFTTPSPASQAQIHFHSEMRKDARALGKVGDPKPPHLVGGQDPQRLSSEPDLAFPYREEAEQHLQQCRLAGSIGAEHASDFAARRLNRDAT